MKESVDTFKMVKLRIQISGYRIIINTQKVQSGRDSGLDSNEEEAIRAMISSKKRENKRKISRRKVFFFLFRNSFYEISKNGGKTGLKPQEK